MVEAESSKRVDLVAELRREVDRAAESGIGMAIRLVGEAGIGKSTVTAELIDAAERRSIPCWHGGASDVSSAEPLAALFSLRPRGRASATSPTADTTLAIRSVFDDVAASGSAVTSRSLLADRFAVREQASELGEEIAQDPMMVVIEDLHWADPASLDACVGLVEVSLTHPLLVVLNHRPEDTSDALARSVGDLDRAGCRRVDLDPLDEAEINRLVADLCGGAPSAGLLNRVRGAGGNPFLVREFVDGLLAEGGLDPVDGPHVEESTPESFRRAVDVELSRLGDEVARTLRAASVIGEPIDVADLARLSGRSVLDVAGPIESARAARLIDDSGGVLRFRHDLVRRAVYERMSVSIRSALHRELAALMAERGASSGVIGSHLVLGVADEDPEAARLLREAAADVMVVDPDSALEFLDRAIDCGPDDATTRRLIQRSRMDALTAAGRLDEAESTLQWLLGDAPPADRAELMARGGGMAAVAGDTERSKELLNDALDAAVDDSQRAPILALAAVTWATARDLDAAREFARDAMTLGERVDEPVGRAVGMGMLGRMSTYDNELAEGLRLGARSIAIADSDATGAAHSYLLCLHNGMTLFDADRLDESLDMVRHGMRVADRFGFNWTRPLYSALHAAVHFRRGAIDDARAEAETSITMGEEMASRQGLTWAYAVAALAAIEQGDVAAAAERVDRGWATLSAGQGVLGADHLVLAGYRVAMAEGRRDGAYDWLVASWRQFVDLGLANCLPLIGVEIAVEAAARDDAVLLAEVATRLSQAADASQVDADRAVSELVCALEAVDTSRWRSAIRIMERTERRHEAAMLASLLPEMAADDPERLARSTNAVFRELGAVARVTDQPATTEGSNDGWSTLTGAEEQIVRLLAHGLTNAQIARERGTSRRTVESHLGRVYRKLAIDGRVALTVAAAQRFRSDDD